MVVHILSRIYKHYMYTVYSRAYYVYIVYSRPYIKSYILCYIQIYMRWEICISMWVFYLFFLNKRSNYDLFAFIVVYCRCEQLIGETCEKSYY